MNLWILTEERPKKEIVETIFTKYAKDRNMAVFIDPIRIIPILNKADFSFVYEITGFKSPKISKVYLKIISGESSFVDYLVFETNHQPNKKDIPLYAIEETKTDDKESRNTGVYQRCSKFVFVDFYYPKTKKVMLYNLQIKQKSEPTLTYIFGTKMLKTLGVEILGKKGIEHEKYNAFESIDDLIESKNSMPKTKNGISVRLTKMTNSIEITAKLEKNGRLGHDPNIGMTTIMAKCLRVLGWGKDIIITQHHLKNQISVGKCNKFVLIANKIGLRLKDLKIPKAELSDIYWHYEKRGEKIGTIFLDILVEEFSKGFTIYSNHAGCERSYFLTNKGEKLVVEKYTDRERYKKGDKSQIINLPDLVIVDNSDNLVVNIEGEMHQNADTGIKQLDSFGSFENLYIAKHYPKYKIERTVVLYGSDDTDKPIGKISFVLNSKGKVLVSLKAPKIFIDSFNNILDFWN